MENVLASISPLLDTLESLIREEPCSPSPGLSEPPNSRSIWQKATSKDVDTLQMQLQTISAIVDKAQKVERCLMARYASASNSLAPVMVLPVEILQCIFNMAVQTRDTGTKASRPGEISAVCRSWRDIAASYGQLWTQIHVEAEELGKVKTLATRTRGFPIELDIQRKSKENDSWMYDDEKMPRLSSLRMALTPDYSNFTPFRLLEDAEMDFSELGLLDLCVDRSRFRGPGWETFRISLEYIKAPSLRIFKIEDFEITSMPDTRFHLTMLSIRWTAMTYIMFHQFLAGSPQLEEMDIYYIIFQTDSSSVPAETPSLTLSSLKRLNMTANFYEDFRDVLTTVRAPKLEELWVQVAVDGDSLEPHEYARTLEPFLSAISTESLTRLGLFSLRPVIREFIKILSPRYPSCPKPNQNRLRNLESLTLQAVIRRDDDAEEAYAEEDSGEDAEEEETSACLQDLIQLLSTRPHQLRELHLSASLVGSTQFHDWLKQQMENFTIDEPQLSLF